MRELEKCLTWLAFKGGQIYFQNDEANRRMAVEVDCQGFTNSQTMTHIEIDARLSRISIAIEEIITELKSVMEVKP